MDMYNTMDKGNKIVCLSAIEKIYETSIPNIEEVETVGKQYVVWGDNNQAPEYLYGLYNSVSTLRTIIEGNADYVVGDGIISNVEGFNFEVNKKGDTFEELVKLLARDYFLYGGFAIQVIRNKGGEIGELYYIDFRYLRSSKKNDLFYYSEEYGKKYARTSKQVVYPKFVAEAKDIPSSILYVTNDRSHTYPTPVYCGAIKSCEIERNIDEFHLSAIQNGFGGSYIINLLNGVPDDEQKAEIERNITEKFAGASNAGRILINFANGKENATKVEKLDITDFSDKYQAAAERSREQIYCSFRAIPQLFGNVTASTGFNEQEFNSAFKLYNRTRIRPVQRLIAQAFDKIFSMNGSIKIYPFTLDGNNEETVED